MFNRVSATASYLPVQIKDLFRKNLIAVIRHVVLPLLAASRSPYLPVRVLATAVILVSALSIFVVLPMVFGGYMMRLVVKRLDEYSSKAPALIPVNIVLDCKPTHFENRAKDFVVTFQSPILIETQPQNEITPLYLEDTFVKICGFLDLCTITKVVTISKHHYVMHKKRFEDIYTAKCFEECFKFSINEQIFKTARVYDQYRLYFELCKELCGQKLGNARYRLEPHLEKNLIRLLIEKIGPFTFLSIPYVDNFNSPPQFPIERTLEALRFQLKINGRIVVQDIRARGYDGWYSMEGIWECGVPPLERGVSFLLSLSENPQGATLQDTYARLSSRIIPWPLHLLGNMLATVNATLEPPLTPGNKHG